RRRLSSAPLSATGLGIFDQLPQHAIGSTGIELFQRLLQHHGRAWSSHSPSWICTILFPAPATSLPFATTSRRPAGPHPRSSQQDGDAAFSARANTRPYPAT